MFQTFYNIFFHHFFFLVIGFSTLKSTDKQPKVIRKLHLNPLASRSLIQLKNAKAGLPRLLKSVPLRQSPGVVTGIRQFVAIPPPTRSVSAVRPLSSTMTTNERPSLINSQLRPVPAPVRQQQRQPIVRQIVRPLNANIYKAYGSPKKIPTKPIQQHMVTVQNTSTTSSSTTSSSTISSPTTLSRVAVRAEGSGTSNSIPATSKNDTLPTTARTVNNTKS